MSSWLNSFFTATKNKGTKKIARTVAEIMPPTTLRPIAFCPPEPAPLATARGRTPKTKASDVMRIGRKRNRAAVTAASSNGLDRKSVVEGKSVSVRVDLGGRRIMNRKKL